MQRQRTSPRVKSFYSRILLPLFLRRGEQRLLKWRNIFNWGEVKSHTKKISILFCIFLLNACETKPYVKHKLKFEKVADDCSGVSQQFQLNSNILGERYEFNKCLSEDFSEEMMTVERQGDTVVVQFEKKASNIKRSEFHIILDIDVYPRYHFLTVDGETFAIVPATK